MRWFQTVPSAGQVPPSIPELVRARSPGQSQISPCSLAEEPKLRLLDRAVSSPTRRPLDRSSPRTRSASESHLFDSTSRSLDAIFALDSAVASAMLVEASFTAEQVQLYVRSESPKPPWFPGLRTALTRPWSVISGSEVGVPSPVRNPSASAVSLGSARLPRTTYSSFSARGTSRYLRKSLRSNSAFLVSRKDRLELSRDLHAGRQGSRGEPGLRRDCGGSGERI